MTVYQITPDGERRLVTMIGYLSTLGQVHVGMRVMPHPVTDAWMKGDMHGTVEEIGRKYVGVRMQRSGKLMRFWPWDLTAHVTDIRRCTADQLHPGELIADSQAALHTIVSVKRHVATDAWDDTTEEFTKIVPGWWVCTDTVIDGQFGSEAAEYRVVRFV